MDKSVTEQDVVYICFADSETGKSAVAFFKLLHHPKVKMHLDLKLGSHIPEYFCQIKVTPSSAQEIALFVWSLKMKINEF